MADEINALVPTGQGAGDTRSSEAAHTAPGGSPAAVSAEDKFPVTAPEVDAQAYDGRHTERGGGR